MKVLYLDPFAGVSGDMFVGALLDAGLDLAQLHAQLGKLNLTGYRLGARQVMRGAMHATKFDVEIDGVLETAHDAEPTATPAADHAHSHGGHDHSHAHGGHEHSHGGEAGAGHAHVHRTYTDIRALLEQSSLSARVKADCLRCFHALAVAEGRIHNMKPEEVGFHEVGALDSIIDIVGVCVGLELLGVDEVWSGAVALGSGGYVNCAHGLMPVPAPATLELMKGVPVRETGIKKELTTPTGAALLKGLCKGFGPLPALQVERIGYGAGSRENQEVPNVLRAVFGTRPDSAANAESDTIVEIETNIDNATPEAVGFLCEKLFALGALDVFQTAIQMKKSRPGVKLTVLAAPQQFDALAGALFSEGVTLGLRYQQMQRLKLKREIVSVSTPYGAVNVKIGRWRDAAVSAHPEYEDCKRLALQHNVPLKAVIDAALAGYRRG